MGTASVGLSVGGMTRVGVGVGTAVGVKVGAGDGTGVSAEAGVAVPVRTMVPGVGSGVGASVSAGFGAVVGEGVGEGAGSAVHPMPITAAPISSATSNAGDVCFRYCFNPIGLLPLEWLQISSGPDSTRLL